MTPRDWLWSVVDALNSRQSKERFMVVGPFDPERIRIWNRDEDVVWTFQCSSEMPERRAQSRATCGEGGCTLAPGHPGWHQSACGCLNGCKAWECPNG